VKPKSRLFAYFQTYALFCAAVRYTKGKVKTTKPAVIYTQALFVQSPHTNLFFVSGKPFMKKLCFPVNYLQIVLRQPIICQAKMMATHKRCRGSAS